MRTFDQALYTLYAAGEITYEAAIAHADSGNDLRLMIKLGADSDPNLLKNVDKGLSLEDQEDQRWGL